jgi:hypothetical protein
MTTLILLGFGWPSWVTLVSLAPERWATAAGADGDPGGAGSPRRMRGGAVLAIAYPCAGRPRDRGGSRPSKSRT